MRCGYHLVICLVSFYSCFASSSCLKLNTNSSSTYLSNEALAQGYYTSANVGGASDGSHGNLGLPSTININSGSAFQPDGTVLAYSVASFLNASNSTPYGDKQVLFRCDLSDKDELYEYYSTNGDDPRKGQYEVSGVPGAYYSDYRYAAFRLTNLSTGEYYTRRWKARKINPSELFSDNQYIYVHAGAFSDVGIEVIKVSNSGTNYGYNYGRYTPSHSGNMGYIAFKGGGRSSGLSVGCDHGGGCYSGWYHDWPGAWGWRNQVTFIRGAYCQVTDYTHHILFPTVTKNELNSGLSVAIPFSISISCESNAVSGTSQNTSSSASTTARPVSIGFLVPSSYAVANAQALGLTTTSGGLTHLLSNDYGHVGVATGVGVRIYDSSNNPLQLLSSLQTGTGTAAGWYGYKQLTQLVSTEPDHNVYQGDFVASLEKLPNESVEPGKMYAQLQIVVSFQ
ncbi:fimbrial usher protein StbD [Vibrio sp. SCSIO 43140]|uniref:fimbrial usher protein StbD n=1 Tax=Vibrio sp. SCSIO 43140 TaxID=2819100 RepID=UPI0020756812|nr:fimbrial usher protein StbD [Vibrio sp. SCSIO 43140]USD61318.1 fimbrial usher protein StbD [Vibrio sp. SCSIO 43140]